MRKHAWMLFLLLLLPLGLQARQVRVRRVSQLQRALDRAADEAHTPAGI